MSKKYRRNRLMGKVVSPKSLQAQADQHRHYEEVKTIETTYAGQDLIDVRIVGGRALCPYADCGKEQFSLRIGIHTCTNKECDRKFQVPDNAAVQDARRKLAEAVRAQIKRDAERNGYSLYLDEEKYFGEDESSEDNE